MSDPETEFTTTERHTALLQSQRRYRAYARECRRAGNFERAGAYYVAHAMGDQMRLRPQPDETTSEAPKIKASAFGYAVKYLFAGGLCYRLADAEEQCRRSARQGEEMAAGLLAEGAFEGSREGLLHEARGDFRILGTRGEYESAYERAAEYYRESETDLGWQMEDEFDSLSRFVVELAQSTEYGLDEATRAEFTRESLDVRIAYKRAHLPKIVEAVIADGNWQSETL